MKKYMIVATLDDRTCPICREKNGTYTDRDDIVPFHPNCRCVLVRMDEELNLEDYIAAAVFLKREKKTKKEFMQSLNKQIKEEHEKLYSIYKKRLYKDEQKLREMGLNDQEINILKTLSATKVKDKEWVLYFLILHEFEENRENNLE